VGGRESPQTVRKRQLLWREQNRKAWRRLRSGQKARYYRQFQKNTRPRIPSRPTCLTVPTNLWMQPEKKFNAGRDVSSTPRFVNSFLSMPDIIWASLRDAIVARTKAG
jgi:hypothetical protein